MKIIDKVLSFIEKICFVLVSALLIGMLFSLSVQVISRFVFNTGFAWTEESARYMMVVMVFIGAIACTKQGIHVAVDAFEEMFPRIAPVLKTIQHLVLIVYCGVVFKFGIDSLPNAARQTSPNMKIPMNDLYVVFPITMVFIGIFALRHLIATLRREKYGGAKDEVQEALEAAGAEVKK